jgi:hypothetical protein
MRPLAGLLLLACIVHATRTLIPLDLNPGVSQGIRPKLIYRHGPRQILLQAEPPAISSLSPSPGVYMVDTLNQNITKLPFPSTVVLDAPSTTYPASDTHTACSFNICLGGIPIISHPGRF